MWLYLAGVLTWPGLVGLFLIASEIHWRCRWVRCEAHGVMRGDAITLTGHCGRCYPECWHQYTRLDSIR